MRKKVRNCLWPPRTKFGESKDFPWTMGWQPGIPSEGRIYASTAEHEADAKIAIMYQNVRFRQRPAEGHQGRPRRQGGIDDHRRRQL